MKKKKCYYLMVSEYFPKTHIMWGIPTYFPKQIKRGKKIHTGRGNYKLWKKRIEEIVKGNAYLSLRVWTGVPYKSKMKEFKRLEGEQVGIQRLVKKTKGYYVNGKKVYLPKLALNDGLLTDDFIEWFKDIEIGEPLALIHFTNFRY